MGRAPCCDKTKVKRGPWSPEEDTTLRNYVEKYGTGGNWIALPHKAGLKRCGKSCRLRWLNYLRPDIKHGGFTEEEDNIILTLFTNIGSRWSVIASHLPGRTDNDVKNYWNTKLRKKLISGAGVVNAKNPSATIPITSGNSDNFSLATSLTPFNQVQAICYGNSTYPPVCYESSDILPYSMGVNQGYPEVDPDMLYQSATDQFPLPGLMEVQENGTPQNGFSTSSSQEFSCLSPSHTLAKSYASWKVNGVGEEVGLFMDLESKSSNYDFDQNIQQGKTVSAEVNHSSLVTCSYPAGSLMASISDSDKAQGLHQSISN